MTACAIALLVLLAWLVLAAVCGIWEYRHAYECTCGAVCVCEGRDEQDAYEAWLQEREA